MADEKLTEDEADALLEEFYDPDQPTEADQGSQFESYGDRGDGQ